MYKVISFDFWDTLVENKSYKHKRIDILYDFLTEKKNDIEYEVVCEAYKMLNYYLKELKETQKYRCASIEERINFIFEKFSICLNKDEITNLRKEFQNVALQNPPILKDNVKAILNQLKKQYSLAIISDTGLTCGDTVRQILKFYDIYKYFDFLIFSDEVGWNKPSTHIFDKIYEYTQCKGHEILHIGDCYETDVQGAILNGVNALYIDKNIKDRDTFFSEDQYYITNNIKNCLKIIKYEKRSDNYEVEFS